MKKKTKYTEQERIMGRMLSNVDGRHLLNNHRYVISSGPRDRSGKSFFQKAMAEALVKAGFTIRTPKDYVRTDTPDRVVFKGFNGSDFPNPTNTRRFWPHVDNPALGPIPYPNNTIFVDEAREIDWENIKELTKHIPSLEEWAREDFIARQQEEAAKNRRIAIVTRSPRVFYNIIKVDLAEKSALGYYRIDDVQQVCGMEWAKCYVPKHPRLYFQGMTEIIQHMERRNVAVIYI